MKVSSKRFQLTLMSDWVAEMIEGGKTGLPFSDFFGRDVLASPGSEKFVDACGHALGTRAYCNGSSEEGIGKDRCLLEKDTSRA